MIAIYGMVDRLMAVLVLLLLLFLGALANLPSILGAFGTDAASGSTAGSYEEPKQRVYDPRPRYGVYADMIEGKPVYIGKGTEGRFADQTPRNEVHKERMAKSGDRVVRVWKVQPRLDELTAFQEEARLIDKYLPNLTNLRRPDYDHANLSFRDRVIRNVKVNWVKFVELMPSAKTVEFVSKWVFRIVDVFELILLAVAGWFGARALLK